MECLNISGDFITFWLNIENHGQDTVFLSKLPLINYTSDGFFTTDDPIYPVKAMGTNDIEVFYQDKIKAAQGMAIVALVFGAALIVADVASDSRDSQKESWDASDQERLIRRKALTEVGLATTEVMSQAVRTSESNARQELLYLPSELFIKTRILPEESYSGKVVFRKGLLHSFNRVQLKADSKTLNFDFRKAKAKERAFLRDLEVGY